MRYILRHAVLAERWETQLRDLLALCERAKIDEVMLMEQSHQILTVPFPLAKHQQMATIYHEYQRQLSAKGIDFSINIATIIGHADSKVAADQVLPIAKFVGDDLVPAHAVYCIADPAWVQYAEQVVKVYSETHPLRLMIDDDFRSLNHTTPTGCFCPVHCELTAKELGVKSLSPRELRDAALGDSDQDLKIRKAWLDVNWRAQLEAAKAMERSVHAVDPDIQVGLMNSGEPAHSAQGRDMRELLQAFAGPGRETLSRPAGGAYQDALHEDVVAMHQISALSKSVMDNHGTGFWVSEVENWPHTRYLKSVATTALQLRLHALWGADAITLNLYDYLGTPFVREPDWERLLVTERKTIESIANARDGKVLAGVSIPWRGTEAQFQRNHSHWPARLLPARRLDTLFPNLGIPVQFAPGAVTVILGDDILAYSESEIREFLTQGLMIDHIAAQHLFAMGFGNLLGGHLDGVIDTVVVERLTDPEISGGYHGCDLPTDWFRLPNRREVIARWVPNSKAKTISSYFDQEGNQIASAITLFENELGGRISVMAQTVHELGWLHLGRAAQLRTVIRWLSRNDPALLIVDQGPNIAPFVYLGKQDGSRLVGLLNTGLDPVLVDANRLGLSVDQIEIAPLSVWIGS